MERNDVAEAKIYINVPPEQVWQALTDPELIKEYMFGVHVDTDWKIGSPIRYTGEWDGKSYEDKGTILLLEPNKLLAVDYWSSMSGKLDGKENYQLVKYRLHPSGGGTELSITQNKIISREEKMKCERNWGLVLSSMKDLLEKD